MTMRRSIAAAAILSTVATIGGMGVSSAQAASRPSTVVTPAQAAAQVRAYLLANSKANKGFDTKLQNQLEGGSAAAIDNAYFAIARALGLPPIPAFTAASLRVYVPRQTHYPAMFVALYHPRLTPQAVLPDTRVLLFQRNSSHSAWKVTNEPDVPAPGPLPTFTVDRDGYIPSLAGAKLAVTRDGLTKRWIAEEKAAAIGSVASSSWSATPLLTSHQWTDSLVAHASRTDVVESDTFVRAKEVPVCIASRNGALCFVSTAWTASLSLTASAVARNHRLVVKTVDGQHSAGGVAKGRYLTLRVVTEQETLIEVPRLHSKLHLRELGEEQGALSGSGTLG